MNILLITSFFPPLNNIASSRMAAFKKYLELEGCLVDVITRYYSEKQTNGADLLIGYQKADNFSDNYIQKGSVFYTNYDQENEKIRFFNKLPPGLKGLYSYLNTDIYQHGWLKFILTVFEEKLVGKKYDFIIASHAPAIAFEAAGILSKKHNIPWIADYRDLFIDFKPNPLVLALKRYRQHTFLKSAAGIIFVSPGMRDFFNRFATPALKKIPTEIVYNGFDHEAYSGSYDVTDKPVIDEFENIKSKFDLVLMHSGSLYRGRNVDFFVEGIDRFNSGNKEKVAIVLLGLSKNNFDQKLNDYCFVLPRVSVNTSFYLQKQAGALLMPIYKDLYTGFSGKVFEYLSAGNTVLYDNNPHTDLKIFLEQYKNCVEVKTHMDLEKSVLNLIHANDTDRLKKTAEPKKELSRKYHIHILSEFLTKLKSGRKTNTA